MARASSSKGRSPKARPSRTVAKTEASDSVGALYAVPLRGGRWGAVQHLASTSTHDRLVALDWYGSAPPSVPDLARAGVLRLTRYGWDGEPDVVWARKRPLPSSWRLLGTAKPRTVPDRKGYAAAESLVTSLEGQYEWDHVLPPAAVAAYKKATRKDAKQTVSISIGGPPRDVALGWSRVSICVGGEIEPAPATVSPKWSALDALPGLSTLEVEGSAPGLSDYLASRPLVSGVEWTSPPAEIDLSRTRVGDVTLQSVETTRLTLPASADHVTIELAPKGGVVTIDVPDGDHRLDVFVAGSPERVVLPRRLTSLTVVGPRSVDVAALLVRCPALRSLMVGRGGPGLAGFRALSQARALERLFLVDRWDLDPAEIGALPKSLESVELSGVRKSRLTALKAAFAGVAHLEIRGVRADVILDRDADCPFVTWSDDAPALGKGALAAWRKAKTAIGVAKRSPKKTEAALEVLVVALNRLHAKFGLDTLRREEAGDAVVGLAALGGVAERRASAIFDAHRDF